MIHGGDKQFLKKYKLLNDGDKVNGNKFDYIGKSKCLTVKTINDKEDYNLVCESMIQMNFTQEEQESVWSIISAVLNLGNV